MIENKTFDEERAFYGTKDLTIVLLMDLEMEKVHLKKRKI